MWLKGVDGLLEIAGGFIFLFVSPLTLHSLVLTITQHELVEDPHDRLASALRAAAAQLSPSTRLFGAVYLLAHGLIKLGLVVGVLRGYRWAYPAAIGFLGLFIAYQMYRLSYAYSTALLLLTIFDTVMVGLVWREYRASFPA